MNTNQWVCPEQDFACLPDFPCSWCAVRNVEHENMLAVAYGITTFPPAILAVILPSGETHDPNFCPAGPADCGACYVAHETDLSDLRNAPEDPEPEWNSDDRIVRLWAEAGL